MCMADRTGRNGETPARTLMDRRGGTLNTARRTFRPDLRQGASHRVRLPGRKPVDLLCASISPLGLKWRFVRHADFCSGSSEQFRQRLTKIGGVNSSRASVVLVVDPSWSTPKRAPA